MLVALFGLKKCTDRRHRSRMLTGSFLNFFIANVVGICDSCSILPCRGSDILHNRETSLSAYPMCSEWGPLTMMVGTCAISAI